MAAGGGTKVVLQAIGGNAFITILKFIGFALTASPSIMAEAVHSLADTLNQILLFIGDKQSKSEAGPEISTGMGAARYVWNLVSAVGIFFIGFGVTFYHGMHSLFFEHHEVGHISWIAIGILVISFFVEGYVLLGAHREVKKQKGKRGYFEFFRDSDDPTILAVLLEDGIAVLGVLLALAGVVLGQITGEAYFDSIVSIIISFLLAFLAIALGITNGKLLIGKRISSSQEDEMKKFIESIPTIQHITNINTKIIGSGQVRLALEVELYGEKIINYKDIEKDAKSIEHGEQSSRVLLKSSERMIRLVGKTINDIELQIHKQYPEVVIIDLEVN